MVWSDHGLLNWNTLSTGDVFTSHLDQQQLRQEERGCCHHTHDLSGFAGPAAIPHYAPHKTIEPSHLHMILDYSDMAKRTLHASVTLTLLAPSSIQSSSSLDLNAISFLDLTVKDVTTPSHGGIAAVSQDQELVWTYDGQIISLHWPIPFAVGEQRQVTLTYTIVQPISGLYFSIPDAAYPNRSLHSITDHETERARYWLPVVDYPTVRTTLLIEIISPAGMLAVANGSLVSEEVIEERESSLLSTRGEACPRLKKRTIYKLDIPCPSYLICVAVGDYVWVEETTDPIPGLPIRYIAPKGFALADLARTFDKTPRMIRWLQDKVGYPFPWPKYHQIVSPFIGGAMENISLVTWKDVYVMDVRFAAERKYLVDMTNIHEMAHTYFGDLLVIRHFEHVWLKESFATYFEALWLEFAEPQEEFEYEMLENSDRYIAETARYTRPIVSRIYDTSWSLFDAHTYPGGGFRIHMLRKFMGDGPFFRALKRYVNTYAKQTVETADFRKCMENECGLNLVKFFEDWFYSKGYPKLKAEYKLDPKNKTVSLFFEQTQLEATPHPVFEFSLDVEVTDGAGKVHRGQAIFANGSGRSNVQFFLSPNVPPKVTLLRIDPEQKVLFSLDMNPGEELLASIAKSAADIPNRVWAYRQLCTIGSYSALLKMRGLLIKSLSDTVNGDVPQVEPYFGVRVKVAQALAKVNTKAASDLLLDMVRQEKDARAMWLMISLANQKTNETRDALLYVLRDPETLPYRALSAALENLGRQCHPEDLVYLLEAAQNPQWIGQHGIIRAGAIRALGQHRSERAFQYLVDELEDPASASRQPDGVAECALLTAISMSAPWQPYASALNNAIELLAARVCSPHSSDLRWRAIQGLVDLDARSSIRTILATAPLWDERDWHVVRRRVRTLQVDASSAGVNKSRGFQELHGLIEALEGRVKKAELLVEKLSLGVSGSAGGSIASKSDDVPASEVRQITPVHTGI